jgi:VanZ family protein
MPFAASLRGSMLANVLALCWQFYWLGAIIHTSHAVGLRPAVMVWLLAFWTLALEVNQAWLPGRSADITPALLPFIWWLASPWLHDAGEPARRTGGA